jgi:hypothetical protein
LLRRVRTRVGDWLFMPPERRFTPEWFAYWAIAFATTIVMFAWQFVTRPFRGRGSRRRV